MSEWRGIAVALSKQLSMQPRLVLRILEKLTAEMSPKDHFAGTGQSQRISPGSEKTNTVIGSLLSGFVSRMMAQFVNEVGVSPGKRPLHRTTIVRCPKDGFSLVCGKRTQTKPGSRNPESK